MKISVIMPAYNEKATVEKIIQKVLAVNISKEIIIVDDGSTDGTRDVLKKMETQPDVKVIYHDKNYGKGRALRTGLAQAGGDIIIFQDADLEYFPQEYHLLTEPITEGEADVVYGSRFLGRHRVFLFTHLLGNVVVNMVANILYNTTLTDLETGYKAFRREVLKKMRLKENDFRIEAEITAKIFKKGFRVYEVPISYGGRGYAEGKKITWKDGLLAIWALLKYRIFN